MTIGILLLLMPLPIVIALKGLIILVPVLDPVGPVLGWLLALFLGFSVLVDVFRNIPGFLLKDRIGALPDQQIQNWKLRYTFFIGVSIFVRVVTVLLLDRKSTRLNS